MIPINRPDVKLKDFIAFFRPKVSNDELESTFSKWFGEEKHCLFTPSGKISIYLLFKFLNIKGSDNTIRIKDYVDKTIEFLDCVVTQEAMCTFKKSIILGYEISWNNFQITTNSFISLEEQHVKKS